LECNVIKTEYDRILWCRWHNRWYI
jgi:hypothetical protein